MTLLRTESFVPLTTIPAPDEPGEFRAKVLAQAGQAAAFQSLEAQAAGATGARTFGKTCEPRVTVQREGDRVVTIRVQCICGQVTDLACVYEEPPKQP